MRPGTKGRHIEWGKVKGKYVETAPIYGTDTGPRDPRYPGPAMSRESHQKT